jgi:hypothetical protein
MISFGRPISLKKAHLKCLYLYHNIYMRIKDLKCSRLCHKQSFKKPHLKCLYLYHNIYMGIQDLNTMVKKFKPNRGLFARSCATKQSFKKPCLKCLYLYHNIYMVIQDLNTMENNYLLGLCVKQFKPN